MLGQSIVINGIPVTIVGVMPAGFSGAEVGYALITGGASGIGLETARLFLGEGARVAITGRDRAALERARGELGGAVFAIESDASDASAQKTRRGNGPEGFGALDVLFLNAGMADLKPVENWDQAAFDRSFASIVKGPFFLIQSLLPAFAKPASVVLNASVNATSECRTPPSTAPPKPPGIFCADALGRTDFARHSRQRHQPGSRFDTALRQARFTARRSEKLGGVHPESGSGRAFRNTARDRPYRVFFASDESAFVVGSELLVDGGMSNF